MEPLEGLEDYNCALVMIIGFYVVLILTAVAGWLPCVMDCHSCDLTRFVTIILLMGLESLLVIIGWRYEKPIYAIVRALLVRRYDAGPLVYLPEAVRVVKIDQK